MPTTPDGTPLTIVDNASHNAFPAVCRVSDGRLLLVYRVGSDHASNLDGILVGRYSSNDGLTWGAATTILNPADDMRDPAIRVMDSGTVIVSYTIADGDTLSDTFTAYCIRSTDDGATWGSPIPFGTVYGTGGNTREVGGSPIIDLGGGVLMAPIAGRTAAQSTANESVIVVFSDDDGLTWGDPVTVVSVNGEFYTEPFVVKEPDGRLHMLVRRNDTGDTYRTYSDDDGQTWAAHALAFDGRGKPAHIQFPSGVMLYVGRPFPFAGPEYRVSEDGGETWTLGTGIDDDLDIAAYADFVLIDAETALCVYAVEGPDPTYTDANVKSQVFTSVLDEGGGDPSLPGPGKAILEIYVHDEDASRWGTATWATGPATGSEGIWSGAGWQDVTPQGVWAHIIWGSRRPDRGILAEQDPASWTVETFDPDRILDPGNPDSPYAPQLLAGVPIRISHDSGLVIRTGQIDDWQYNYRAPQYRGRILASDTIATLYRAYTPADSILGDTLLERIQDAINAAGIMVGGIPLPPGGPSGPALSEWVEGAATDDDTRVWDIMRRAGEEVLYVIYVNADASIGVRPWGSPLERGREIAAPNLEDLASRTSEDGVFSVVKVQVADPDLDPIIREAAPLPRYGRRVYERTETTIDPEGWADAVLADRAWQGVQYVPGAIHCFTAADVDYFGSIETMERVQITHPGAVTVSGRVLGGELWVEHRKDAERGASWIFQYQVATDGSTAIGLTTLVSDQAGEPLLDDMTETDFLEAD